MKVTLSILVALAILQKGDASELFVTSINDTLSAHQFTNIVVGDITVPPGVTFTLSNLQNGTTVTFNGTVQFGYSEWTGPLLVIEGQFINVIGTKEHRIHAGGERWWDGKGGIGGIKKPQFFAARLNHSTITGLRLINSPEFSFMIYDCVNLTVSSVIIDNSEGDKNKLGHNTDGFDLKNSRLVTIRNCLVKNQDDCFAMRSGSDVIFENNYCSGGHGISIGSVGGRLQNDVARVLMRNNVVQNSANGIRVKTVLNATGSVTNVTFENTFLHDIQSYGIVIQGNYLNLGPRGDPTGGVPISGLTIRNIYGNVLRSGANYYVWVTNATNWDISNVLVSGGKKTLKCKGYPAKVIHLC